MYHHNVWSLWVGLLYVLAILGSTSKIKIGIKLETVITNRHQVTLQKSNVYGVAFAEIWRAKRTFFLENGATCVVKLDDV